MHAFKQKPRELARARNALPLTEELVTLKQRVGLSA